jgi:hypothetical protein
MPSLHSCVGGLGRFCSDPEPATLRRDCSTLAGGQLQRHEPAADILTSLDRNPLACLRRTSVATTIGLGYGVGLLALAGELRPELHRYCAVPASG